MWIRKRKRKQTREDGGGSELESSCNGEKCLRHSNSESRGDYCNVKSATFQEAKMNVMCRPLKFSCI